MTDKWKNADLLAMPGHYARRVHQLVVALFVQEVADLNLTPLQYSSLYTICNQPGIDQKTLANTIGYDTATIGGVIDRLESRGLVMRNVASHDRRLRLVTPTDTGIQMLEAAVPRALKSQERLLAPLTEEEGEEFMRLMKILIDANAELSKIPTKE
ncbi:MAG: MarR family transcriptional regulator [Pseudomonadota bacterium]